MVRISCSGATFRQLDFYDAVMCFDLPVHLPTVFALEFWGLSVRPGFEPYQVDSARYLRGYGRVVFREVRAFKARLSLYQSIDLPEFIMGPGGEPVRLVRTWGHSEGEEYTFSPVVAWPHSYGELTVWAGETVDLEFEEADLIDDAEFALSPGQNSWRGPAWESAFSSLPSPRP